MTDAQFDAALIAAAFSLIARSGWRGLTVADAARAAGLELGRARARFGSRGAVLVGFGVMADAAALEAAGAAGAGLHETLFDMLMRRIDVLQAHRAGVLALLDGLPADPATALMLAGASARSMRWLAEAAGMGGPGTLGGLRGAGLLGVWLWTVRAWRGDEGADLPATMAALDAALSRAAQIARSLPGEPGRPGGAEAAGEPAAPDAARSIDAPAGDGSLAEGQTGAGGETEAGGEAGAVHAV